MPGDAVSEETWVREVFKNSGLVELTLISKTVPVSSTMALQPARDIPSTTNPTRLRPINHQQDPTMATMNTVVQPAVPVKADDEGRRVQEAFGAFLKQ